MKKFKIKKNKLENYDYFDTYKIKLEELDEKLEELESKRKIWALK